MASLESFALRCRPRGGKSWLRSRLLYPRSKIGLIQAKESLLKTPLSSSGACPPRRPPGEPGGGTKHSRASSKARRRHVDGARRGGRAGDGAVRATRSHITDARRCKVARSDGFEARRCSRYSSRFKPRAASSDTARDKERPGSSSVDENKPRDKSRQSTVPTAWF